MSKNLIQYLFYVNFIDTFVSYLVKKKHNNTNTNIVNLDEIYELVVKNRNKISIEEVIAKTGYGESLIKKVLRGERKNVAIAEASLELLSEVAELEGNEISKKAIKNKNFKSVLNNMKRQIEG